jgi:hypothetical protein
MIALGLQLNSDDIQRMAHRRSAHAANGSNEHAHDEDSSSRNHDSCKSMFIL